MSLDRITATLATVPWKEIPCLTGSSEHVPAAVIGLATADAEAVRAEMYWLLENRIVVQGGLFESAFYTVPFLIALLHEPDTRGKQHIYDLLFEIGNGGASYTQVVRPRHRSVPFSHFTPDADGPSIPVQVACRSAVVCGIAMYVRDVGSDNALLHEKSLELISSFTGFGCVVRSALETRMRCCMDLTASTRASIMRVINAAT